MNLKPTRPVLQERIVESGQQIVEMTDYEVFRTGVSKNGEPIDDIVCTNRPILSG